MWQKTKPTYNDYIRDIPNILRGNWAAIEDIFGVQHYSLTTASAGRHIPGKVSVVFTGTTQQIAALTNVPSGALAYDTTIGYLKRYTGTNWVVQTATHSRMRAYCSTITSVTTGSSLSASGDWVVFDTEMYDDLSEYNPTTGIFTALASGYYLVTASVMVCASGPELQSQAAASAISTPASTFDGSVPNKAPSAHHENIDEYPTPSDSDYLTARTSGAYARFGHSLSGTNPFPPNTSGISAAVAFRARARGCVCDNACYSQNCACDLTCNEFSCTCNDACYGYVPCSCNLACNIYSPKGGCAGYSPPIPCSCDMQCHEQACNCNAEGYGQGSGCGCYEEVYMAGAIDVSPFIRRNSTNYSGNIVRPSLNAFSDYVYIWDRDPATSQDWTTSGASAIEAFGIQVTTPLATSGCSADISQMYMLLDWFPLRPLYILRLYKNNVESEIVYTPIVEAGAQSNQTINLNTIVYLDAGSTLRVALVKISNIPDNIINATEGTYFTVHRVEGQCV